MQLIYMPVYDGRLAQVYICN